MPQRDRFGDEADDYHEEPPGRAVRRSNPVLLIALAVGGGLVVGLLAICGIAFLGAVRSERRAADDAAAVEAQARQQALEKEGAKQHAEDVGFGLMIQQEYTDNATAAEKKWAGKLVRVEGTVLDIGRDTTGFFVAFDNAIRAYPVPAELEAFGAVKKGDTIILEGVVRPRDKSAQTRQRITLDSAKYIRKSRL
jgi:hypothetical protein